LGDFTFQVMLGRVINAQAQKQLLISFQRKFWHNHCEAAPRKQRPTSEKYWDIHG